uniref:RNA-guided endonuclease InsQ/TnpB family protein n=1 Tax=Thermus islandicus TaxID=540988 RepID=UPI0003B2E7E0
KYDGLCIEDLNLKGMAKTKLSLSVLDAALGEFRRQLEYKSLWYRKHLVVIDRYFPSSKLCRECGAINQNLALSDRVWACGCGAVHERDLNAAQNIRAEGIRKIPVAVGHTETQNAWGEGVRPTYRRLSSSNQESHRL